jgi:hypothetical protein
MGNVLTIKYGFCRHAVDGRRQFLYSTGTPRRSSAIYIYELHAIYVIESCKIEINFMQFM